MSARTALSAMPLSAIDAVVLDSETTGLDLKIARMIQVGAVLIERGNVSEDRRFEALVHPGIPIPPASTEVHGIADDHVADAPNFDETRGHIRQFTGDRLWIGHSIGFDLAIMASEHEKIGEVWEPPRSLDTRLLAEVAEPRLPSFELDALANWLGIEIVDRHTALADAVATAQVFLGLVPKLRAKNIRTVAEAEAACRKLSEVLDGQYKAGWVLPVRSEASILSERALARLDAYPYRHRSSDVMSSPPKFVAPDAPLQQVLDMVIELRISSVFVGTGERVVARDCGIVTERDLLRAMASDGMAALQRPVSQFASKPLQTVRADAFLYRALGRMTRLKIRHLGVEDEDGLVVGAISARDLLKLRTTEAISLGDEIDSARTADDLGAPFAKLPGVANSLLGEDVPAREVAAVISRELAAMTRASAMIAERQLLDEGFGGPPADYAVLILGSGGRGESLLAADQDNAIIHDDIGDDERASAWFARLGEIIADTLDASGVPYCKGGIMAKNAEWRGSVHDWKQRIDHWIVQSRPQDLLNVDIFYDLRAVYGSGRLAREIYSYAYERGSAAKDFLKLMADSTAGFQPPLGLFGGLKTEGGRLDLKKGGLFPIVANARVLAIRHNVMHRATPDRLDGVKALGIGADHDLARTNETHAMLIELMLNQQLEDIERGIAPSNGIEANRISPMRLDALKAALSSLKTLDSTTRDLLFAG
ncbi:MAG: DUF294 nucleotidyltransferase-like domain-containing protein [Pseudomonadota bacterium]